MRSRGSQLGLVDSPTQVIIETPADLVRSFDGVKFGAATQAAIAADLGAD